jgi:hypothetical protein
MYVDDYFNPANEEVVSVDLNKQKKTALFNEKMYDKNYFKFSLPVNRMWKDGKYYRYVTVEMYGSGCIGSRIRNAVSGEYTKFLVGSLEEDLFFKAYDCRGLLGTKEPIMLYYQSPEQYENHLFLELDSDFKELWNEKYKLAEKRYNSNKNKSITAVK